MKILIISDAWRPQINGVVRTYEYLIPELEKMGHEIKVIGPKDFPITMPMPGYTEIKLAFFTKPKLKKMIEAYAPDSIHIATEGPLGISAQKYCLKNKLTFSTSYHTQFPEYLKKRVEKIAPFIAGFAYKKAIKKIVHFHNQSTCVLITTESILAQLKNWGVTSPLQIFTRGIDQDVFNTKSSPSPYADIQKPIALYVGRIAIEKNIEDFLEMDWAGAKVIVGQGPDEEKLQKKYPSAVFAGKKTGQDLASYYKNADIFVFPSKTDTFGMVLIEALACGIPIAAYPVMGPKDIVTENFLGALNDDLASASETALKTGQSSENQERADHAIAHYTWKKAAKQFIKASPKIPKEKANA